MLSYLKVLLLPKLDVVGVDRDEVVPVRPRVLVHEAESVEQLVDRGCQARVETNAKKIDLYFPAVTSSYLLRLSSCSPPTLPRALLQESPLSEMVTKLGLDSTLCRNLMQGTLLVM